MTGCLNDPPVPGRCPATSSPPSRRQHATHGLIRAVRLALARRRRRRSRTLAARILAALVLAEITVHSGAGPAPVTGTLTGIATWLVSPPAVISPRRQVGDHMTSNSAAERIARAGLVSRGNARCASSAAPLWLPHGSKHAAPITTTPNPTPQASATTRSPDRPAAPQPTVRPAGRPCHREEAAGPRCPRRRRPSPQCLPCHPAGLRQQPQLHHRGPGRQRATLTWLPRLPP